MPTPDAPAVDDADRRRLRDAAAERVMGWHAAALPWATTSRDVDVWHAGDGSPVMPCAAWRPDEDDRHCMRLVERMLALGFAFRGAAREGEWEASFERSGDERGAAAGSDRRRVLVEAALDAM